METRLHQQLKLHYAGPKARFESPVAGFRVDVVCGRRLIEIQHGPLGAIRDKVRALLDSHAVLVVKPIIRQKVLIKLSEAGGAEVSRRLSPKRGRWLNVFDELIHFTRVFPHQRLTIEVPLVDVEERRFPGHGRRRRWRENDFEVEEQSLVSVGETFVLRTTDDLLELLRQHALAVNGRSHARFIASKQSEPFDTARLAEALGEPRWVAQRIAYCLLHTGGVEQVGKRGNARLFRFRRAA